MAFGKKPTNETIIAGTTGLISSHSSRSIKDIFATESSEQAKQMIMSGIRHEFHHGHTVGENETEEIIVNKVDPTELSVKPTIVSLKKSGRKTTMLLTGPKFRSHTVSPDFQFKRDTLYPVSVRLSRESFGWIWFSIV
jgi:hypothetical protein